MGDCTTQTLALKLPQFQYILKRTFLWRLVFLCLFAKVTVPPRGGGGVAKGGGDYKGGGAYLQLVGMDQCHLSSMWNYAAPCPLVRNMLCAFARTEGEGAQRTEAVGGRSCPLAGLPTKRPWDRPWHWWWYMDKRIADFLHTPITRHDKRMH